MAWTEKQEAAGDEEEADASASDDDDDSMSERRVTSPDSPAPTMTMSKCFAGMEKQCVILFQNQSSTSDSEIGRLKH